MGKKTNDVKKLISEVEIWPALWNMKQDDGSDRLKWKKKCWGDGHSYEGSGQIHFTIPKNKNFYAFQMANYWNIKDPFESAKPLSVSPLNKTNSRNVSVKIWCVTAFKM